MPYIFIGLNNTIKMKKIITLLYICFLVPQAYSQNVEFTRENFKNDKELKKTYNKYVKQGDKFYFEHERGYLMALEFYMMAYKEHPNSALLNYKIADCYLHTLYKYSALKHAQEAVALNPNVMYDIDYVLGMAYHQRSEFDVAISHYQSFKATYSGKDPDSLAMANKRIEECLNGKEIVKEELYDVVNMGPEVNSEYAEYVPLIKADQSMLLFTARKPYNLKDTVNHPNSKVKGERLSGFDFDYFEDIFKTERTDSGWSKPVRFDYSTQKKGIHDASVSLSFDGLTIYNYRSVNQGDLYYSEIENGKWNDPKPMEGINSKYRESHVAIAFDNNTAYFVSDRPGGYGGKDIYKATRLEDDKWGNIENLGPEINTQYEEDGVFIHPDGKTLYFSSKGHNTMGGYDIFRSTFEDGKWSTPENVGYPVNSPDDDIFFVLTADGKHAYLSSVKEGGYGMQDIYVITPYENKKQKPFDVVLFKGIVIDKETKQRIDAKVEIVDNSTNTVMFSNNVDAERGFLVTLPTGKKGKNYGIAVESKGYLFYSENFDLVKKDGFKEYDKVIEMEKVKVGSILTLRNIFFDFDRSDLKQESKTELDRALKVLAEYPNIKIQIEGHTDNIGSEDYNLDLSQRRAKAVETYLLANGLDPKRIVKVLGFGESKPVETNDTDEGRAHNRRVEFRIME
jgi:outer membrane protein OmpA-like peptidoglycan-associated protein/tetratricopeptide (TPR) repeat protein